MNKVSNVRMILEDYDNVPDGIGYYIKHDSGFESVDSALLFRSRFYHNLYWGRITDIYGKILVYVDENHNS